MNHDERDPSEGLRQRVAELYAPSPAREAQLGPDAQRRVIQAAIAEAQHLRLARARRQRRITVASVLLLSAAAAFWLVLRPREQLARREAAAAPACGLPLLRSDAELEALEGGRRRLLLGSFGTVVVSDSADISVEQSQACELALRLERGVLAGDLHSLRPARLTIRTPQGEVVVTGTRFSVQTSEKELEVLLASGVVDVVFADRSSLRMPPGTQLRKAATPGQLPMRVPLTAADDTRLSAFLAGATGSDASRPSREQAATAPAGHARLKPVRPSGADSEQAQRRVVDDRAGNRPSGDINAPNNAKPPPLRAAPRETPSLGGDSSATPRVTPRETPSLGGDSSAQLRAAPRETPSLAGDSSAPLRAAGRETSRAVGESDAPLLAAAESARRAGRIAEARIAYRAASRGQSDSAEIALLRWVRLELDSGAPEAAQRVLAIHRQRFARGRLGAEAGWQAVQVWQALARPDRAREAARELITRYADTPQATGARQVLEAP